MSDQDCPSALNMGGVGGERKEKITLKAAYFHIMWGQLSLLPTTSKHPVLLQNNNNKKVLSEIFMGKRINGIDHRCVHTWKDRDSKVLNLLTVL